MFINKEDKEAKKIKIDKHKILEELVMAYPEEIFKERVSFVGKALRTPDGEIFRRSKRKSYHCRD